MLAPDTYTDSQAQRHATFQAATRGLSNWKIAQAMNVLRPSHDYRGSPKGEMADDWCREDWFQGKTGGDLRAAIVEVTA